MGRRETQATATAAAFVKHIRVSRVKGDTLRVTEGSLERGPPLKQFPGWGVAGLCVVSVPEKVWSISMHVI